MKTGCKMDIQQQISGQGQSQRFEAYSHFKVRSWPSERAPWWELRERWWCHSCFAQFDLHSSPLTLLSPSQLFHHLIWCFIDLFSLLLVLASRHGVNKKKSPGAAENGWRLIAHFSYRPRNHIHAIKPTDGFTPQQRLPAVRENIEYSQKSTNLCRFTFTYYHLQISFQVLDSFSLIEARCWLFCILSAACIVLKFFFSLFFIVFLVVFSCLLPLPQKDLVLLAKIEKCCENIII